MGWGRTLLLGDIGNRLDIGDVETDVADLRDDLHRSHRADATQDEMIQHLHQENAELKLYLAAVVRLLTKKGQLTRDELAAMVQAVDAEDGQADGGYDGEI